MAPPPPRQGPPPPPEPYEQRVLEELTAIKDVMDEVKKGLSGQPAEFAKQLAKHYNAQPSKGGGTPVSPQAPSTSSLALSNTVLQRQVLKALASVQGKEALGHGASPATVAAALDEEMSADSGSHGGKNWTDRVSPGAQFYLPHMKGASLNPADLLGYMATQSANRASRLRQAQIKAIISAPGATTGQGPDEVFTEATQHALDSMTTADLPSARLSNIFGNLQSGYIQGQYMQDAFHRIATPLTSMRMYGLQTGAASTSAPMFLGMRSPFDTAGGFGQKLSQLGFAANHNVTPDQAGMIYNNLFGAGFYGGASTNAMRSTAAQMMNTNPYIASQPQYYQMMDSSTRYGATSLSEFNATMMQVPNAAKSAHQSITTMLGAMQAMGQLNQSIGGTYQGGLNAATDWATASGLPPQAMGQMLQNPMVKSQIFAGTGLLPFEQGLASPSQKGNGIMNALNLVNGSIVNQGNLTTTDPITGLKSTISGEDQKLAMMAQLFPGMSPTMLKTMLHNQKGIQAGLNLTGAARTYRNAVGGAVDHQNWQGAYNNLTGAPWQRMQGAMKAAVDSKGHHIFENWATYRQLEEQNKEAKFLGGHVLSEAAIHRKAQKQALDYVNNAGDTAILKNATNNQLQRYLPGGRAALPMLSQRERATLAQKLLASGQVSGHTEKLVSEARMRAIQNNVNRNTQKFGPGSSNNNGPSVTIGLNKAAAKLFNLQSQNGSAKANVNAGAQAVNQANISLPTPSPTPDMNTMDNSNWPAA